MIRTIRRYPVKGLPGEELAAAELQPGKPLPRDRTWAVAFKDSPFHAEPGHHRKRAFLQTMQNETMVLARVRYGAGDSMEIALNGDESMALDLGKPEDRLRFEELMARLVPEREEPKLVAIPGISFSDQASDYLSIINLASVEDIQPGLDERRFRGNLMLEGAPAWIEHEWVGKDVAVGEARGRIVKRIDRCAATTVNQETAARDVQVPKLLMQRYGNIDCGVFLEVTSPGRIATGDAIRVVE